MFYWQIYHRTEGGLSFRDCIPWYADKPKENEEEIKTDEAETESRFHTPEITKKENGTDFSLEKLHQ